MNVEVASDEALTMMTMRQHLRSPFSSLRTCNNHCGVWDCFPGIDGASVMTTPTGLKAWMKGNWGIGDLGNPG